MGNNDKIYEAYIGNLGDEIKNSTHKRINWILEQVKDADNILDVGCSQGIISLLMAKENKKVLGLDIQKEAVDFANTLLKEEFEYIDNNIEFRCLSFFDFDEDIKFDAIVMTEVLEHLENPLNFIIHAKRYLNDNGLLVITVPFGVNNHPDHYSTFYLSNIIDIIEKEFQVERVEYMGRWLGLIAKKCEIINKFSYCHENIALLEKNFSEIDWEMTRRIEKLYVDNIEANKKYKKSTENYSSLKEKYNNSIEQINNINEKYKKSTENYSNLKEKYSSSVEQINNINQKYRESTENYNNLKEKYSSSVEQINNINQKYRESTENYNNLKDKYSNSLEEIENLKEYNKKLLIEKEELSTVAEKLVYDFDDEILILKQNKALINKLETQKNYLKHENDEYRRKMSLIKDTFIGRVGMKVYKILKKLKGKLK